MRFAKAMRERERAQIQGGLCPNGQKEAWVIEAGGERHVEAAYASENYDWAWRG